MWSTVTSPVLIGSEVRILSAYELETLLNPDIMAVSQDSLGQAA